MKILDEFVVYWADYFKPNKIFCQIGYRSDRSWWEKLETPPTDIEMTIARNVDQDCRIFWIDIALRDVLSATKDQIQSNHSHYHQQSWWLD